MSELRRPMSRLMRDSGLERREFLKLTSGLASLLLAGCGGAANELFAAGDTAGGSDGGGVAPALIEVQGQVDRALFGALPVKVQSIYGPPSPVADDGSFRVLVSAEGTQLLVLTEVVPAQGELTGNILAVTLRLVGVEPLFALNPIATTLVFLTPGLLTLNTQETRERLQQISQAASFAALVGRLSNPFTLAGGLGQLLSDPNFRGLRDAVVTEVANLLTPQGSVAVEAQFANQDSPATSVVNLSNGGYRFVSLIRSDLGANGQELPQGHGRPLLESAVVPLGASRSLLAGANGLSWGNLFSGQQKTAGSAVDPRSDGLTGGIRPGVERVRYYAWGPGKNFGPALPPQIQLSEFDVNSPFVATLAYYTLFPILDLVAGVGTALNRGPAAALELAANMGPTVNTEGVRSAINSGQASNVEGAVADFYTGVLLIPSLMVIFGATSPPVLAAGAVLGASAALFTMANLSLAAQSWFKSDNLSVLEPGARLTLVGEAVVAVNRAGDFVFREQGQYFLRRVGRNDEPIRVYGETDIVGINDDGVLCYRDDQGRTMLRGPEGEGELVLPLGARVTGISRAGLVGIQALNEVETTIFFTSSSGSGFTALDLHQLLGVPPETSLQVVGIGSSSYWNAIQVNNQGMVAAGVAFGSGQYGPSNLTFSLDLNFPVSASILNTDFAVGQVQHESAQVMTPSNDQGQFVVWSGALVGPPGFEDSARQLQLWQNGQKTVLPYDQFDPFQPQLIDEAGRIVGVWGSRVGLFVMESDQLTDLTPQFLAAVPDMNGVAAADLSGAGLLVGTIPAASGDRGFLLQL